ncbi:gluconate permease [Spirochaetales bacterium BR193]|uniref:Gluconate permease n=2 Tax=Entomospira entomophila TaxID=2719988 RepID=A0A968KSM5_9SPIO|nr:gluconate:H+ symporter [Entomospira entomophilus]NIZ40487.1 gluconate permease [Entomospira entomophilus]
MLIGSATISFIILLFLIIRVKLQPILALLISAIIMGLGAGMSFTQIIATIEKGVGSTLQGMALLIGIGSMFGAILEISGGAEQIATTLLNKFGDKKAPWALGITGLVVGIPIFFDAGLIILLPLAFSVAKKTQKSVLLYAIPLLAGLAVGHAFLPPTPGPVIIASLLGVELSYILVVGLLLGSISMIVAGPIFGTWIGSRIFIEVPDSHEQFTDKKESTNAKRPPFSLVITVILIPLLLILLNTVAKVTPAMAGVRGVFEFLGTPFVALLIATVIAMVLLGTRYGFNREELEKVMTKSLEPTGLILLVTAGGGVLRWMIQDSGLGDMIGAGVAQSQLPIIVVAFLLAGLVRVFLGSATVAMTLSAGLVAAIPEVATLSQWQLAAIVAAIAGGSTILSHVNDSGFWLVKSLLKIDEKTTLKSWTMMETLVGFTGFIGALIFFIIVS